MAALGFRAEVALMLIVHCPLCLSEDTKLMYKGSKASQFRDFLHCGECDLVFVPRHQHLDEKGQKERYLQHNNDVNDPAYREFLGRMYYELRPYLDAGGRGLDYGCGPGPALQQMMIEDGFDAQVYDIYFFPDNAALASIYDFITCTETVEHFEDPRSELDKIDRLLREGGWLGVMTGMLENWVDFPSWYYHRDPTHVNFFSQTTMRWIAKHFRWDVRFPKQNVSLFRKGAP